MPLSGLLDLVSEDFEITRGSPLPLGVTLRRGGIQFALFSRHATKVHLVFFPPGSEEPVAEFPLDSRYHRTGDVWHVLVRGIDPGIGYGYRVYGPGSDTPPLLHRFRSDLVLADPHARAFDGWQDWGSERAPGNLPRPLRSLVVDDEFDWDLDQPLNVPLRDTLIYELHVRGFTRHPSSGVSMPGTYAGLVQRIPYLKSLGVTAVELLPVQEFDETDCVLTDPATGRPLLNLWGYATIGFFAPKSGYAADRSAGGAVREFKALVKAFHQAGIEVILDMAFNHTGEGDERGPTLSFRGIDNDEYYLLEPTTGAYRNFSGCGNTLNCNHPVVRDFIIECLQYWVMEMHVDGFRFDLASILGRGRDGEVLANPPLIEHIAADPVLAGTKLIAEAWDAAGLYQVGSFPSYGRWAEWNGRFRDDVRRFVRGDPGQVGALATRLLGSPDLYDTHDRNPCHSINFLTSHDGFTLRDMVSYDRKHNDANGENGADGDRGEVSFNCGVEGDPRNLDASARQALESLRRRQVRNLMAILMLSRGVPMVRGGDEIGRTQRGNNNAWCQDNDIGWVDWTPGTLDEGLLRYFRRLVAFRSSHACLRAEAFGEGEGPGGGPINWHGVRPLGPDWTWDSHSLAAEWTLRGREPGDVSALYAAFNAWKKPLEFRLPAAPAGTTWRVAIDTACDTPDDIREPGAETALPRPGKLRVAEHSVVVLVARG
jgi:glycogen operon protein